MGRLKYMDWFTTFGAALAGVVLSHVLRDLGVEIYDSPWVTRVIIFLITFFIIVLIPIVILIHRMRVGREIIGWDERINAISARSARNALFMTYVALFVHQLIVENTTLDSLWVLIIIVSGLIFYLISYLFYSYRKG